MAVALQLRCDLAGDGCQKGSPVAMSHAPYTIGVTMAKLLRDAQSKGWSRIRGKGWACPVCVREWQLATQVSADVVNINTVRRKQ